MSSIRNLSKSLIILSAVFALMIGASNSFAQNEPAVPITVVDPATGRVVEAPKHFSAMSAEEKAAYSAEDLKLLQNYEAKIKEGSMTPKPKY